MNFSFLKFYIYVDNLGVGCLGVMVIGSGVVEEYIIGE